MHANGISDALREAGSFAHISIEQASRITAYAPLKIPFLRKIFKPQKVT